MALYNLAQSNAFSTTLNGNINAGDSTITLTSVTGLQYPGILVIDRLDNLNEPTPLLREYISYTGITGSQLTGVVRGVANSTDQGHGSGAKVEEVFTISHWNDLLTHLEVSIDSNGNIKPKNWVDASDAGTVNFDLDSGTKQRVTLGGNRTLTLSNAQAGQAFVVKLTQDATGSRTVTWFDTISWPGGTAPTLTTAPSKSDVFGFIQDATDSYMGFICGQNI